MRSKFILQGSAAVFAGAALIADAPPAHAACGCPAGSQWVTVGQSTKADTCGLQVLLHEVDASPVHADRYLVYVKSSLIPPVAGPPSEHVIPQNGTVSIPAGKCGSLLIGAHRAPQKDFIELNWSYF